MFPNLLLDRLSSKQGNPTVDFIAGRCLRSRLSGHECRACLEACGSKALLLTDRGIGQDLDKCSGCMCCVSVCPNDAFNSGIDLKQLLDTVRTKNRVVLTCRNDSQFEHKITVPCLGFLSEPLLAAMNTVAGDEFFLDLSHCPECENGYMLSSFHETARDLLDKLEGDRPILLQFIVEKNTEAPVDEKVAKRLYLRCAKSIMIDLAKGAVEAGNNHVSTSCNPVVKEPAMQSLALFHAYKNASKGDQHHLLSYFYTLRTNERCNVCPMCQGMCPTGALKRIDMEGDKQLIFTSSSCSGCGLCREFCKNDALEVNRGFSGDPDKPLRLA